MVDHAVHTPSAAAGPILDPGYTYASVTEKISSIVLTRLTPCLYWRRATISPDAVWATTTTKSGSCNPDVRRLEKLRARVRG